MMKKVMMIAAIVASLIVSAAPEGPGPQHGGGMGMGRPTPEMMEQMMQKHVDEMFAQADKNADGVLSKEEFKEAMKARMGGKGQGMSGEGMGPKGRGQGNGQRGGMKAHQTEA